MPKKKVGNPKAPSIEKQVTKIALGVVKIQEALDKTLPMLATKVELAEVKQRVARVESELNKKPNTEEVQRIVNLEMNKAAEVINSQLKERDEKLQDHEGRLKKLEAAIT